MCKEEHGVRASSVSGRQDARVWCSKRSDNSVTMSMSGSSSYASNASGAGVDARDEVGETLSSIMIKPPSRSRDREASMIE